MAKKLTEYEELQKESALLASIREKFDTCLALYSKEHTKIRTLDLVDNGQLWKALGAKFPPYQILPDTNFVTYVKSNLVASIYTVAKSAQIQPTSEEDKDLVVNLNVALEHIWDLLRIGDYQFAAGEWAALSNLGITQVGWDDSLTAGSGDAFTKGCVALKNIDPMKFMRDPFATDLETAGYCMTYDVYHKSVFLENPNYKEKFKEYLSKNAEGGNSFNIPTLSDAKPAGSAKDYFTLITIWIKEENGDISETHVINCEKVLYRKDSIKPKTFPFALLYCNKPRGGRLIGVSEPAKIFANNVAYNLLDSIALTAEYKNQRPPKYVSQSSGLNVNAFAKHSDDAGYTFIVNGDASKAVHYHEYPQINPNLTSYKMDLRANMQTVTGVDERYTGRDTGSIITTGGVEDMLNRVTLVDTPKILNYETYTKRLSSLILSNMILYSQKRVYLVKEKNSTKYKRLEIDFPSIPDDAIFNYVLNISSDLPKNKQRIAQSATMLMEKQLQYQGQGQQVDLITPEEWLSMQDLPNKEMFLERMGIQRNTSMVEEVSTTLFNYAGLVENGMDPEDAILATAKTMQDARSGAAPMPEAPVPAGTNAIY